MSGQEILGESLGSFELRGTAGGAEAAQAGDAEVIDHACDQRCLGTDDRQPDLVVPGKIR